MARTYARCASYVDEGVVSRNLGSADDAWIDDKFFATAFERPGRFRFLYRDRYPWAQSWKRSLIWRNNGPTRAFRSYAPPDREGPDVEEFARAIAGFTGVSAGSAHTVPRMLLPTEVTGWCITELEDVVLNEEALDDVGPCFRVRGFHPRTGDGIALYIQPDTMLLRRLTEDTKPDGSGGATTTYTPSINVDVTQLFSVKPESLLIDD
ncbi:MAG: hypothetical protein HYS27_23860 [Deltaproteobacteria bacterium]|nr:hypothetical protein [Deltaproteobacteria bacterium]